MESVQEVGFLFRNRILLQEWQVLSASASPAVDGQAADGQAADGQGADRRVADGLADDGHTAEAQTVDTQDSVDDFLLRTFEALARVFVGLHCRSYALWLGGVYSMADLLAPEELLRANAIQRGEALWPRIVAMEHAIADSNVDPELVEFAGSFLWHRGTVYRELLQLLSEGRTDDAAVYAWRVFSSVYHEKGSTSVPNAIFA